MVLSSLFNNIDQLEKLPRNFRDLEEFNLQASASAQFTEDELAFLCQKYRNKKLIIVDLRYEYHGFVDGNIVSYKNINSEESTTNNFSFNHSQEKTILLEMNKNKPFLTKSNEIEILTEEQLCQKHNCQYYRFALKDHTFPTPTQLEEIIDFLKKIEQNPNNKIHIHCAAGRGRTAIFLAIYDIFKNHRLVAIEEIFKRHAKLGGADLNNIANEYEWSDEEKKHINILFDLYNKLNQH